MNRRHLILSLAATLSFSLLAVPALAQEKRPTLSSDVAETIATMRKTEPGIEKFFKRSVGYVVFPRVGKGGFIFAGGHGDGQLFERGKMIGEASITIVSVGFTVGAQQFSEIIFFENQAALDSFKQGKFEVAAQGSVVILKAGVADALDFRNGAVIVVHPRAGAMVEGSIGAQKFNYKPGR